ncbi:glycosyltransferase family 2 protein, partial [Streptomyces purpurogeneiscleroticus]|uniref:glycosyltransferase family 2 protein n=1 Tax=Streptomyces purpurogeneiscleroticus TaxID=68259 RepID=UPI001CC1398A
PASPPASVPGPRQPVRTVAADAEPPRADIRPLPEELTARRVLNRGQSAALGALLTLPVLIPAIQLATGSGPSLLDWARWAVLAILLIDVVAVVGQSVLVLAAWRAPVLRGRHLDPYGVPDEDLPRYTVLVPLHQEHRILPDLVQYLSALNYPTDRLQILLLIENDDHLTRAALEKLTLGPQFQALMFTPSLPRTKPKACNIGLRHATGDLCVVYDAEDRPAPDQLRLAAAAFRRLPDHIVCVQAELQFWNPWTNWLTECFAAEYALRYSLVLHGLDRLRLPVPLGGTSNHFRTAALCDLGAWDPYNVTEDADLGMRLARRGMGTRMLTSVTYEEANSEMGNWIRQRSRWIKGHIQTWLVHNRNPLRTWRELGTRGFLALHFTLGLGPLVQLLNPALWLLTLYSLLADAHWGRALLPSPVREMALTAIVVVNLMLIGHFAAACAARRLHRSIPTMLSLPLNWVLMSLAAYKALGQLLRPSRRHFWELTRHGLAPQPTEPGAHVRNDPTAPPPDDKPTAGVRNSGTAA